MLRQFWNLRKLGFTAKETIMPLAKPGLIGRHNR